MPGLGSLAESGVIALAVSEAAGAVVEPALEPARQEAEKAVKARIHDMPELAQAVAQTLASVDDVLDHAARNGFDEDELRLGVQLALKAPGVSEALNLYRRRKNPDFGPGITLAQLHHAYAKGQVEYQYWPALDALAEIPLTPAEIALGVIRGLIPDPGFMPVQLDTSGGVVPKYQETKIDAVAEASLGGIDSERLRVMVGSIGRPPGPNELARALFRGLIRDGDYNQGILEGDVRPEWGEAFKDVSREISTAHDAVENHLRGYSQASDMYSRAARHGMSQEDVDIIFQNAGRPLTVHQITTGLARGGTFQPIPGELTDPYEASVHESNIKPSYYDLAIANRYSYPSLFQLNALVKANAISADTAKDWATKDGLAPEVVDALYTFWQGEQSTSAGAGGAKAKGYTYSQIHQAWRHSVFTDQEAVTELEAIGYPAAKAQTLLAIWQATPASGSTVAPIDTTGGTPH